MRERAIRSCFAEIGEAANHITPEGRVRIGQMPWRQIVGTRSIVVHVYWGVDLNQIVKTIRDDLPALVQALESALSEWPGI